MSDTQPENSIPSEHIDETFEEKSYWIDNMKNVYKVFWALVTVCALLVLADAFIHKHSTFSFQNWFGFFGFFGFILSFLLVLTSRQLRKIVMRDEDYYDH
jgi:hypothetical protein